MSSLKPHEPSAPAAAPSSFPAVRLTETQDHLTVVFLVPGFAKQDLTVTLAKDVLRVSGKVSSVAPRDFRPLRRGRRAVDFDTEIKLLAEVACSHTEAELERGVLTVRLRKDAPEARSVIPIRLS